MINENEIIEYTPIIPSEPIVIQKEWFEKQHDSFKKKILNSFENTIIDDFDLPHKTFAKNDIYYKFFLLYKMEFAFDNYVEYVEDAKIIQLEDKYKNELIHLCYEFQNKGIHGDFVISQEFNNFLNDKLNDPPYFVKTSYKSAKKNKILTPTYNSNDFIFNLISSKQVLQSLLIENCNIVLKKWVYIDDGEEFRFYVLDKKIKCICQQQFYKTEKKYTDEQIINCIKDKFESLNIKFNDCVIDCYVKDNKCHIIEINSGCCWSTAGSGLFTWKEIMEFKDEIVLRTQNFL